MLSFANARRCTCKNEITWLQSHHRGYIGKQGWDVENNVPGGRHLAHLPVHAAGKDRVGRIELGIDPGAEGTESIEALGTRPLVICPLQVTRSDIVANGVPQD